MPHIAHENNRQRLLELKDEFGNYRALASHLGLQNTSYLWNYIHHGTVPGNRTIRKKLGIIASGSKAVKSRQQRKDALANELNYHSWSAVTTAAINGIIQIPTNPEGE